MAHCYFFFLHQSHYVDFEGERKLQGVFRWGKIKPYPDRFIKGCNPNDIIFHLGNDTCISNTYK